jgi:hypothetical protein
VLLRRDTELVVEGVVPNLLHVIPVCDDTVLDRVLESEDTTLRLRFVTVGGCTWSVRFRIGLVGSPRTERRAAGRTSRQEQASQGIAEQRAYIPNVGVFLAHTDHDTLVARTTDN